MAKTSKTQAEAQEKANAKVSQAEEAAQAQTSAEAIDQDASTSSYKTIWGEPVSIPEQPKGDSYDTTTRLHTVYANHAWRQVTETAVRDLARDQSSGLVLPKGSKFDAAKLAGAKK